MRNPRRTLRPMISRPPMVRARVNIVQSWRCVMAVSYRSGRPPSSLSPFRLNSFRLEGLHNLDAGYRIITFTGLLADDDDYEKKLRLLPTLLSSRLRRPVDPFRDGDSRRLAVAGSR